MTEKDLRTVMMKSKKDSPLISKAYMTILSAAQIIAKNDKNRDVTPEDIVQAAKKENKMAEQSKAAGAPYNEKTFEVTEIFLPKMMPEADLIKHISLIIAGMESPTMKQMGQVMGSLSKEFGNTFDKGLASKIVRKSLS